MSSPPDRENLTSKALRGVQWTYISTTVGIAAQLVFTAIMARLLEPSAFGLVAMAIVLLRFGSCFAQKGIGPALIQKREVSGYDVRAAWTLAVALGFLFALFLFSGAALVRHLQERRSGGYRESSCAVLLLDQSFSDLEQHPSFANGPIDYAKMDEVKMTRIVRTDSTTSKREMMLDLERLDKLKEGDLALYPSDTIFIGHTAQLRIRDVFSAGTTAAMITFAVAQVVIASKS